MTIAQYLQLLRQQWVVVALLAVCGALGSGVYTYLQTPQYTAQAQLFVSPSGQSESVGELTQVSTFTQQRVKSYTNLITSPRVLDPVITSLHLPTTARKLKAKIQATSPLDTVLINITVTDSSPGRAQDVANAIAAQFPTLIDQLETPIGKNISPVKVSVTQPAIAGGAPVSPRKSLNLALGLLVGLGLGISVAVLRQSMDRSVGDPQQAAETAGAPILGLVGDDPKVAKTPLITHDAFSPRAEAFKHLRTNIRFLSVDHQLRSLVVTGSVASEGKTTTAANLAIALAQSGERVVLIDADLRRPAVADLFGLSSGIGLTSVLIGEVEPLAALQNWSPNLPLQVMTSGPVPPNPSELIGSGRMMHLIEALNAAGNTVVIDSPPLLPVTDAAVLGRITDGALVVTRVGSTHLDQLATATTTLRTAGATVLGLVLNRVGKRNRAGYNSGYSAYGAYTGYRPKQEVSGTAALFAPSDQPVAVGAPAPAAQVSAAPTPPASITLGQTGPAVDHPIQPPPSGSRHQPAQPHSAGTSWIPTAPQTTVVDVDAAPTLIPAATTQTNGYPGNGYPSNGHPDNGHPGGGYPGNGYEANGYTANGNPVNGYTANGYRGPGRRLAGGTTDGPPPEAPPRH